MAATEILCEKDGTNKEVLPAVNRKRALWLLVNDVVFEEGHIRLNNSNSVNIMKMETSKSLLLILIIRKCS
jgi:hypothetical protein